MSDPDDSFKVFMKEINPLLVQCFKYKKKQIKSDMRCVLYNRELLLLSRKKDRLYKVYLRKKTLKTKEKSNKVRNFYFHMIAQKKKEHTQNQFQNKQHSKNLAVNEKSYWQNSQ